MTSTSVSSVSIFDIHLIVTNICDHLSSNDIWSCTRVCKDWASIFMQHHWRDVWLVDRNRRSRLSSLSARNLDLIRKRSHWVRVLAVDTWNTSFLDTNNSFDNLRRFICKELIHFDPDEFDPKGPTALDLLSRNPRLRVLEIECQKHLFWSINDNLIPMLPKLSHLQCFEWDVSVGFDHRLFFTILQNIPPSLRNLGITYEDKYFEQGQCFDHVTKPPYHWKLNGLSRFAFMGMETMNEDHFLIPFIKSCPSLKDLTIPTVSSKHVAGLMKTLAKDCPRLENLTLNYDEHGGSEASYFGEMHHRFKNLSIEIHSDRENKVVPTLMAYAAETLQVLQLDHALFLESSDLVRILASCPNLEHLYVRSVWSAQHGPRVSVTLQDLVKTPWKCKRLRFISLTVTDAKAAQENNSAFESQAAEGGVGRQRETAMLILQLFHKLKTLPSLGDFACFHWHGESLRMPVDIGLGYMDNEICVEDLKWMKLQWPAPN
ncbi:hypothetical protein EDD21DRAFT_360219 [Dissophora ornata]|nr:hypothetical protein BGZ58_010448 [Dissophora ornata]KAI8606703.1 hypothetical protein EDD21DRAFT_360219 [Dissophora ornata]